MLPKVCGYISFSLSLSMYNVYVPKMEKEFFQTLKHSYMFDPFLSSNSVSQQSVVANLH